MRRIVNVNTKTAKSQSQIEAELAQAMAVVKALKAQKAKTLTLDRSPKGCVMIKGLRRFGIALYPSELRAILQIQDQLLALADQIEATQVVVEDEEAV